MKKMKIMTAIMLVAGMTQAAAVAWNTGAIKSPTNPTGVFGANVGITTGLYLVNVAFYTDAGGTSLVGGLTGISDNSTSSLSVLNATTSDSFAANTTYWAQAIVTTSVNSGGGITSWIMTSTLASFTTPGTGNAGINFFTGAGFGTVNNKMPTSWTAVPEPTSMALLALGVAAIGLRRKNRK